jgi:hypothetical protein
MSEERRGRYERRQRWKMMEKGEERQRNRKKKKGNK